MSTAKSMILRNAVINFIWYTGVTFNEDGTVTIYLHDRKHTYRDTTHPASDGQVLLNENEDRTVHSVSVQREMNGDWSTYTVHNPQHIFTYGRFEDEGEW